MVDITEQINHIKVNLIPTINLENENEKLLYKNKIKNIKQKMNIISVKYEQLLKTEKLKFNDEIKNIFKSSIYDEWKLKWETIENDQIIPLSKKIKTLRPAQEKIEQYYVKNASNAQKRYEQFIKILTQDSDPILNEIQNKINKKHQLLNNLDNKKLSKIEQINIIIDETITDEKIILQLNKTRSQNIKVINSRYKTTKYKLKHEIRKLIISAKKYTDLTTNQFKKIQEYRQNELFKIRKIHQKSINKYTEKIKKIKEQIKVKSQKTK